MAEKTDRAKTAEKQVRIPAALHKRLSIHSAKAETTNSALAVAALDEYLKKRGA